ncbi:MAG: acyl-CoA dehydrogenase family protein [Deltaproteobacteria bacterium]|nr:acyl-CoA dehydrogenase family protein [Deltaproteobacteria bacterium]MBW2698333.1 acyl-CoA dehydrogenase family protein [Deltaproteobacteria bacterium]
MNTRFSQEDEAFRREIAGWLADNLSGEFAAVKGRGGPGDEHALVDERKAWERRLGEAGWIGVGLPGDVGGRELSLTQQVIFYEEYARADGPGRMGHIGEGLLAPTLVHFGSDEQKQRFLPGILSGEDIWCQGYSEPGAGSDLANVQTRAELDGDEWVLNGQKVWTSGAAWSDWCFAVCRSDPEATPKHAGISYILCPMDQPGVEVRPIVQMTGDAEFSEVFFNDARTARGNVVGEVNGGWKVAMGTLAFERGASTLGQQMSFQNELDEIIAIAKQNGKSEDPIIRQRIADAWIGLRIQRYNALRTLSGEDSGREGMITKIYWATWHRNLGKLAMDVIGPASEIAEDAPYALSRLQRMYLFARSDTIYAGSNQIQRNIISERALGMPREPRPA